MRALVKSLRHLGEPVPVPWDNLSFYLKPRVGNLMAVAAASGVGKSMFALAWTVSSRVPSLYVSLDTTLDDQALRLLSQVTQQPSDRIAEGQHSDPPGWAERWGTKLKELDLPLRFADTAYTLKDIDALVMAETEYWGRPPAITVIDNIADLLEEEESAAEYHRVFGGLRKIAKQRQTMVMALHHLRRKPPRYGVTEVDQGQKQVYKTDILYGGDREVQYLLGLHLPRSDTLRVSILKNRMGMANPSGGVGCSLKVDYSRATLTEDQMRDSLPAKAAEQYDRRREEEGWR